MRKFRYLVDGDSPDGQALSGDCHYTLADAIVDAKTLIRTGEAAAARIWKLDRNEKPTADAIRLFLAPGQ